ncbi:MAG: hypothetical protein PHQ86_07270, partial [Dehalococcoidales bacterium]|nr:hypothetical protein [Dehalococcoidales bacterium]
MLSDASSELIVSGSLASCSRLVNGQSIDGLRDRLEASEVRHSLRRQKRRSCSLVAHTDFLVSGRCIG